MLIRGSHWVAAGAVAVAGYTAYAQSKPDHEFTERYGPRTQDTGPWALTDNPLRVRTIEPSGGNPGGYLYGEVSSPIPTWSTASTRYQPGSSASTTFTSERCTDRTVEANGAAPRACLASPWIVPLDASQIAGAVPLRAVWVAKNRRRGVRGIRTMATPRNS